LGGKKHTGSDTFDANVLLYSYFIVTISVVVFHFTTSKIGHLIIDLLLDKSDLRQLFYFVIFVIGLAAISCIFVINGQCQFIAVI
jgi:ABC-type bacteriocin/lantibiotic exporter with double-glycine peptidase domain